MYHDIKNFKQNIKNVKTKKLHDKVQQIKKQAKLDRQRIKDEAYLKKKKQEKDKKIRKE